MSDDDYGLGLKVHEDAYRELEEELDKAKAELEEVGFRACRVLLERDEAREQRDRLAEALWSMLNQDDMSAIRAGILLRSLGLQSPTNPNKL
jgi:hypothetical protein